MQRGSYYRNSELFSQPLLPENYFRHKTAQEPTITYDSLKAGSGFKTMLIPSGCPYRLRLTNDRANEATWNERPRMLHLQHSSIPITTSRVIGVDPRTPITTESTGYRNIYC